MRNIWKRKIKYVPDSAPSFQILHRRSRFCTVVPVFVPAFQFLRPSRRCLSIWHIEHPGVIKCSLITMPSQVSRFLFRLPLSPTYNSGMSEQKPRAVWPWIFVGVLLPVIYVAAFGPACWIAARTGGGDSRVFQIGYWPLGRIIYVGVPVADAVLVEYAEVGLPRGAILEIPGGPDDEGTFWKLIGSP
jgi:hypothetical protein